MVYNQEDPHKSLECLGLRLDRRLGPYVILLEKPLHYSSLRTFELLQGSSIDLFNYCYI